MKDDGVSSVIGALLVLVSLTVFLALLQATTVPGMNRDAEAAHADKVAEQFATLQEKVDAAGADGVARTADLTPGTLYPQVPLLYNPIRGTSGSVSLLQEQRIFARYYGGSPFAVNRSFTASSFPFNENGLATVTDFTMTLTDINSAGGDEVTVTATGGYATTFGFDRGSGGGSNDLIIDWGTDGGGCPNPQTVPNYFLNPVPVDILACETGLAKFGGVTNLAFAYSAPGNGVGSYALAGTRNPQNSTPMNATAAFLELDPNYNYWSPPGPSLRYEHGSVLRTVGNRTSMADAPALLSAHHNATSNITRVSLYVPRLNATNATAGQRLPLSVRLMPGALSTSNALANNLTLEVDTSFPAVWASYFNSTMAASGLAASGNWSVATTAARASLDVDRGATPRLNITVSSATVEAAL